MLFLLNRFVYNPIDYASEPHRKFLRKYLKMSKSVLFLGMNPGPWGMMQTGVPFGEVTIVREWLEVRGEVSQPSEEHPKRPVEGFACARREVSGERLWGLFKDLCRSPDVFFRRCFVYNHCPLGYLAESGKNVTPVEFEAADRRRVEERCDEALRQIAALLHVEVVVGLGRYAAKAAQRAITAAGPTRADSLQVANVSASRVAAVNRTRSAPPPEPSSSSPIRVIFMNHPSPASAAANKGGGWAALAKKQLREAELLKVIQEGEEVVH